MSDSMPCIWMSAGLVAYKLCDREYDCESCPFDAAMRGCSTDVETPPVIPPPPEPEFPSDRRYHHGHLWVRSVGGGRVRVGLDAFAAALLRGPGTFLLPSPGTPARRDLALAWLHEQDELVPLRAPLTGRVVVTHGLARHRPELVFDDPYGEGWLFELKARERAPVRRRSLLDARGIRDRSARQQADLDDEVRSFVHRSSLGPGPTLQDGGARAHDPRAVLGSRRYYRIISAFLI
jgi:glycine cleavage system H protein